MPTATTTQCNLSPSTKGRYLRELKYFYLWLAVANRKRIPKRRHYRGYLPEIPSRRPSIQTILEAMRRPLSAGLLCL